MDDMVEPFARMIDAAVDVRALEAGAPVAPAWRAIAASGWLDALVADDRGGAGLTLARVAPLVAVLGARAVPLPVAETMVARAMLAHAGIAAPDGPIVLGTSAWPVPGALLAGHALADGALVPIAPAPTGVYRSLAARAPGGADLRPIAAVLRAGLIAGAAARLTDMTRDHANARVQFGKPIGRQQALQQMLAVMAEDMVACRIAAQIGMNHGLSVPAPVAATAKIVTSAAAPRLAQAAHAVHGAIGIAEECDVQLLTRRLHEWRLADGSEGYWSGVLGRARLQSGLPTVDWVRAAIV